MMNLSTHIYLYAKGHYECGDLINDLREIVSHRNNISPRYVSVQDIINILTKLVYYHLRDSGNTERFFVDFIDGLLPRNLWMLTPERDVTFEEVIILKCLSVLRMVEVDGLDLGDADADILPLSSFAEGGDVMSYHEDDDMVDDMEDCDICASVDPFDADEFLECED